MRGILASWCVEMSETVCLTFIVTVNSCVNCSYVNSDRDLRLYQPSSEVEMTLSKLFLVILTH